MVEEIVANGKWIQDGATLESKSETFKRVIFSCTNKCFWKSLTKIQRWMKGQYNPILVPKGG